MNKEAKFLLAIYISVTLALLFSCNTIEKATQKVLTNENARNKVGAKWAALNPCINDTTLEFIQGDSIVTYQRDTLIDTKNIHDTTETYYHITNTITKIKRDTVRFTVIDMRGLNIVKDSLAQYKRNLSKIEGKNEQYGTQQKKDLKIITWLSIALFLAALSIGLLIRLKFL